MMKINILSAMENHHINLGKINNKETLQYLSRFKRYSTEKVMKSLVGELTENEKWSVKGALMGECWYKDCCVSNQPTNSKCGKPEIKNGSEKMKCLFNTREIQKAIIDLCDR